jgi:hypothetical protein
MAWNSRAMARAEERFPQPGPPGPANRAGALPPVVAAAMKKAPCGAL